MTTERDSKNHALQYECDICGEVARHDGVYTHEDFRLVWEESKSAGWRTFQIEGMWQHKCPACVGREK